MLTLIITSNQQNLICNGDFENYSLTNYYTNSDFDVYYNTFPADNCWYFKNSILMEIDRTNYGNNYTQMCELNVNNPNYALCQNVNLKVG